MSNIKLSLQLLKSDFLLLYCLQTLRVERGFFYVGKGLKTCLKALGVIGRQISPPIFYHRCILNLKFLILMYQYFIYFSNFKIYIYIYHVPHVMILRSSCPVSNTRLRVLCVPCHRVKGLSSSPIFMLYFDVEGYFFTHGSLFDSWHTC